MIDIQYRELPLEEVKIGGTFQLRDEFYLKCEEYQDGKWTCAELQTGKLVLISKQAEVIEKDAILEIL